MERLNYSLSDNHSSQLQVLKRLVALTDLAWEHLFVVNVGLYPCHQLFDICWCSHLCGLFVVVVVLPEILKSAYTISGKPTSHLSAKDILICGLHLWAGLRGAKLSNGSVEQVDLVVKVDHWRDGLAFLSSYCSGRRRTVHCKPLVLVLALRKLDDLAEAASAKSHLGILTELIACGTTLAGTRPKLVLCALVAKIHSLFVSWCRFQQHTLVVTLADYRYIGRIFVDSDDGLLQP